MTTLIRVIGYLIIIFAILALMNGLKKYTRLAFVHELAKYHYTFGGLAVLLALSHIILNIVSTSLSITGLIVALLVVITGSIGGTMKQTQNYALLSLHKACIGLTLIALIVHIIL
ncbi:MAG: hypothetical protein UMR38_05645 [Candidatus Izemoplasma sp.]|nr:hypothetical protein [Candidatus Izemoplasma sp.]